MPFSPTCLVLARIVSRLSTIQFFNICIITKINIIHNNGISNHAVVSDKCFLEQDGILHCSIDNASAGNETVLHIRSRIIFGRRKVADLGIYRRILFEEVIPHFRFQKIHICMIVGLRCRDIAPATQRSYIRKSFWDSYTGSGYRLQNHTCLPVPHVRSGRWAVFCELHRFQWRSC